MNRRGNGHLLIFLKTQSNLLFNPIIYKMYLNKNRVNANTSYFTI